ncbi:AAA family ATPase [Chitinibacteraceae bacterium HSL-7]
MIFYFSATNFLSFYKPLVLDWRLTPGEPDDHLALSGARGDRVSKVLTVLGANASGKTNAIRAVVSLSSMAAYSFRTLTPGRTLPVLAHQLHTDEPTKFEIEFEASDDNRYRYTLEVDADRVIAETLKVKGKRSFVRIFERLDQGNEKSPIITGVGKKLARDLRQNVTHLSWCAQHNVTELQPVWQFFSSSLSANIDLRGRFSSPLHAHLSAYLFKKDPALLRAAVKQLQRWDIDISDIELDERIMEGTPLDPSDRAYPVAVAIHKRGDHVIRRDLSAESSGTQSMFALLSAILPVLRKGGIAVIDELEADLHPHMVQAVLDLFLQPEFNPHGAQLLCTTHAAELISQLHKPQIVLVEKVDGYSECWSLRDMHGIDSRDNYAAKYLAGAYGGVPEL